MSDTSPLDLPESLNQWRTTPFKLTNDTEQEEIDAYIRYKVWEYSEGNKSGNGLQDEDLWEQFKEDFDGFTADVFKASDKIFTRNLRFALRRNGVWVNYSNKAKYLAESLAETLQEVEPTAWKLPEITASIAKQLQSKEPFNHVLLHTCCQPAVQKCELDHCKPSQPTVAQMVVGATLVLTLASRVLPKIFLIWASYITMIRSTSPVGKSEPSKRERVFTRRAFSTLLLFYTTKCDLYAVLWA